MLQGAFQQFALVFPRVLYFYLDMIPLHINMLHKTHLSHKLKPFLIHLGDLHMNDLMLPFHPAAAKTWPAAALQSVMVLFPGLDMSFMPVIFSFLASARDGPAYPGSV